MMVFLIVLGGCLILLILGAALILATLRPFAWNRPQAIQTTCQSNVKQMAMGLQMYAQDYDDRLPPAPVWGTVIQPYIRNPQLFRCPQRQFLPSGYAYNYLLDRRPLAQVLSPAQAPMVHESSLGLMNGTDKLESFVAPHGGNGTLAYVDGHIAMLVAAPAAATGLRPASARPASRPGEKGGKRGRRE